MVRTLVALPAFYLISRAPQVAAALVGVALMFLLGHQGMPFLSALMVLAVALLGLLAVRLACTLPVLHTTNGKRRAVRDACWQAAEAVAVWAGWLPVNTPDDSH